MENLLTLNVECGICFCEYDNTTNSLRSPRLLKCGHTFCFECLKNIFENNHNQYIECPLDRIKTRIENLDQLPTNRALIDSLINLSEVKKLIQNNENDRKYLLNEISNKMKENKRVLNDLEEKLFSHINSNNTVMLKANKVINVIKNNVDHTDPIFNLNEFKQISNYIDELRKDLEFYTFYLAMVQQKKERLNEFENELNQNKSIVSIDRLAFHIEYLNSNITNNLILINDERIKKNPIGLGHFFDLENQMKSKIKVSILLRLLETRNVFRIGVIGLMKVGKSSFINRVRGLLDIDNNAAIVDNDEATSDIMEYAWNDNVNVAFTDFPGLNSIPLEKYIDYVTQNPCDVYIIMFSALFENDIKLAKHIFTTLNKEFLFCRSRTDESINTILEKKENRNEKMSEEEAIIEHKNKTLDVYDRPRFDSFYDEKFTKQLCKERTFLVCCKSRLFRKYEWNKLIEKLLSFADLETAEQIAEYSPFLTEKKLIRKKREALEKRITSLSIASGLTDFVPIGGVIADIIIIVMEAEHYRKSFGLTEEGFKEMEDIFKIQLEDCQSIKKIIRIDSFYINMKNTILTILTGLSTVPAGFAVTKAILGTVGVGVSVATFGIGCVISGIISGPISYVLTKKVLTKILCQMEFDSFRMLDLFKEKDNIDNLGCPFIIDESSKFIESDTCAQKECNAHFKLIIEQKKHCGKCLKSFCSKHCSRNITIPKRFKPKLHRVCDECFQKVNLNLNDEEFKNAEFVFWKFSEKCMMNGCEKKFNWKIRKHHCRACGACICGNHSKNELKLSVLSFELEEVCDDCYESVINI